MTQENRVVLRGTLAELDALRYTPAGIPIVRFRLHHQSAQMEAGVERKVECEIGAVAFEREARLVAAAKLGSDVKVTGFLAAKSRAGKTPELHATAIEFVQGE